MNLFGDLQIMKHLNEFGPVNSKKNWYLFETVMWSILHSYTPRNEVRGGYIGFTLSVCPSVRLSVCLLTFRVRPVASTVQDGFFPYLVQMINSMRGCVACDDLWPWPISSRSFGLDLENPVCSIASTVLDGFFLFTYGLLDHYLTQHKNWLITWCSSISHCAMIFVQSHVSRDTVLSSWTSVI